jgi:hypothetical protein
MTLNESINRGFNLMVTAVLVFGGTAFGAVALSPVENDWSDRLDDIGLVLIGLLCLAWYLIGRNRVKRSLVPVALAGLAMAVQLLAVLLERDDPVAFGDNYIGLIMFVPFFVVVVVQYVWSWRRFFPAGNEKGGR